MKIEEHRYPTGSTMKRLRELVTKPFRKNAGRNDATTRTTARGEAGSAVDKSEAGKPV